MIQNNFIGIDIAKSKFNAALKIQEKFVEAVFENNTAGHEKFVLWLKGRTNRAFACLESTGPYGEILAEYLVQSGVEVSVVNPMQIKHYAKSILSRNKNDRVDAKIIACYAEKFTPRKFVPKSTTQKLVKESVQLIATLIEQKRQLQNQLESIRSKEIRKEIEKMIELIEKRISKLEETLNKCIQNNDEYHTNKQRLLTIIGIGEKTANRIIAYLPNVSEFKTAKQLAAYVGVSPKQYQSGGYQGKTRLSKCGNSHFRKSLYMPALVAKNNNPYLKQFCERLEKNGLRPKQIICAVMRKLIHIIFGMLKHNQNFNPALI
jgi:transposase